MTLTCIHSRAPVEPERTGTTCGSFSDDRNAVPVPFWENGSSKLGPARSAAVVTSHETDVVDADCSIRVYTVIS